MRSYRSEIRIIQIAVILAIIVIIAGLIEVRGNNGGFMQEPGTGTLTGGGTETEPAEPLRNTKIVCLGDSYTLGYPGDVKDAWPAKLQELLRVEVVNAGQTGQTTNNLLERFDTDVVAHQPGRVVIAGGVGDALRDRSLEDFQKGIVDLVNRAEANHIKPILALPIPYPDPAASVLIEAYRNWMTEYAKEKNLTLLDFKTTLCGTQDRILTQYAARGEPNHANYPSKEGHDAMAAYAAGILQI